MTEPERQLAGALLLVSIMGIIALSEFIWGMTNEVDMDALDPESGLGAARAIE